MRERTQTAVTQEKHWLFLCFDLFCRFFWNFFFPFSPRSVVVVNFIGTMNLIKLLISLFLFFLSHIFYYCYKPLPLCWAFAVLGSFLNLFFPFYKPIIIFSTLIPLFAFPTVLFPLQLIFNIYKSSLSTSI